MIVGTGHGVLYEENGSTVPCWTVAPDLSTVIGCCQTLEVATDASMEEIVKAFRVKAKLYHPDRVRNLSPRFQELATEEFHRLHRAYEQLTRATARPMVGIVWVAGLAPKESANDYTLEEYRLLAQANPNNANVLYNLAWKCFEAGLHQEASDVFLRVLALNPTDQDAAYNAAVCKTFSQLSEVLT
jgi:curved DNA-binding protein CbpA